MDNALKQLQALLESGQVSTSPSVLEQHGRDENFPEVRPPLAVAYAESREDVQTVLEWCRTWRVPLIPFGAGTSLEGALVPNTSHLSQKEERQDKKAPIWHTARKQKQPGAFDVQITRHDDG